MNDQRTRVDSEELKSAQSNAQSNLDLYRTEADAVRTAQAEGTAEQQGARSIAELERYRDDCLLAVLGAIRETKARHGFAFAE